MITTGATNSTVVTLSTSAEAVPVTTASTTISRYGRPPETCAAHAARKPKSPVWRRTLTMIIIPNSKKMTFQSIPRLWS